MNAQNVEYIPLKVTAGILIHIGAGIYNSPAGAIKELVSNSYDADATTVVITTDYPKFEQIKVVDNGSGMTSVRFKQAMRSIGSSLKGTLDPDRLSSKFKRPIIGQLGIGFMALSQICSLAVIESQAEGSDVKFVAELDFSEFKKREADQKALAKLDVFRERYGGLREMKRIINDPETDPELREEIEEVYALALSADEKVKQKTKDNQGVDPDSEQLGYCTVFPNLPAVMGEKGTVITLKQIEPGIRDLLRDIGRAKTAIPSQYIEVGWDEYRRELSGWSWQDLCQRLRLGVGQLSHSALPKYFQFLWELAIMTPVQYLPSGPVTIAPDLLKHKKRELDRLDFSLNVDSRLLFKPILLPSGTLARDETELEKSYDYYLETFEYNEIVDGERLKCQGYLYWQRKQIQPNTLRGIQIYIRNVGIGLYDHDLMEYAAVNPGAKAPQISGEIYVEEGLERALNVDRNSFRETDAHYLALQQKLWNILGSAARRHGVIGMAVESYWIRKDRSNEDSQASHIVELRHLVDEITEGQIALSFSKQESKLPYELKEDRIVVYDGSPRWPRSRAERHRAQRILITVEAALAVNSSAKKLAKCLEDLLLRP